MPDAARLPSRLVLEMDVAELRLSFWAFLWASAILFSLTATPVWFIHLSSSFPSRSWFGEAALATLAVATMLRPNRLPLLMALAAGQLVQTGVLLPEVPNHRIMTALGNLLLITATIQASVAERRLVPSAAGVWERFAPAGRALLLIVYAFAFLAKLNRDFVAPVHSCAAQFYEKIVYWLPLLPRDRGTAGGLIATTLLIEGVLPLFLAVPRFRKRGVVLGIAFHLALSFDLLQQLVNFSSAMFALLALFLPDDYFTNLAARSRAAIGGETAGLARSVACVSFLALIAIAFRAVGDDGFAVPYYVLRQAIFVTYGLVLLGTTFVFAAGRPAAPWLPRSAIQAALLCLALLNGLSPYLGLKTRTSFNMYSNLRVEADGSNHFLVPRSLDALGFLSDTVAVLQTTDAGPLSEAARRRSRLTWFEFSSYVNERSDVQVVYERNGKLRYLNGGDGAVRPLAPPWLLRKLLLFRPVGGDAGRDCVW